MVWALAMLCSALWPVQGAGGTFSQNPGPGLVGQCRPWGRSPPRAQLLSPAASSLHLPQEAQRPQPPPDTSLCSAPAPLSSHLPPPRAGRDGPLRPFRGSTCLPQQPGAREQLTLEEAPPLPSELCASPSLGTAIHRQGATRPLACIRTQKRPHRCPVSL